ncbi:hypothetical protein [Ralstonia solanacearum]|uniref:hypothetical protein n=1 Tax=Ralstonia solanacearum TaxID=305 RepID=UPI001FFCE307|nr:hypothetical protein [Ralstonia solanacearum]
MPIDELRKRDADCDGDKVFVYAGVPKMAQAITRFSRIASGRSAGCPRSSPQDGQRRLRRGRPVPCRPRRGGAVGGGGQALVRRMSTLQFHFWGQPQALRERIAEYAIFGTYEGTRRELRRGVRRLLYNPAEATGVPARSCANGRAWASKHARHPVARQAAEILQQPVGGLRERFAERP